MAGIPISTRAPSESADTLASPPLGPEIKMCQKTDGTCHTACNLDKKYPDIPFADNEVDDFDNIFWVG